MGKERSFPTPKSHHDHQSKSSTKRNDRNDAINERTITSARDRAQQCYFSGRAESCRRRCSSRSTVAAAAAKVKEGYIRNRFNLEETNATNEDSTRRQEQRRE